MDLFGGQKERPEFQCLIDQLRSGDAEIEF